MSSVIDLTAANWDELVIRSSDPVLVVVSASWCGACQKFAPIVEKAADNLLGVAQVGRLEADQNRSLLRTLGVRALPTSILFVDGREVARFVGSRSETEVEGFVRRYGLYLAGESTAYNPED